MPRFFLCFILILLPACGAHRPPVPPGTIPQQSSLSSDDEQYGHEVLSGLTDQYRLDTNDARIDRVRGIVDKLTAAAGADFNPWHVYVFDDDGFKNAAATRGNYVFVWSGIINTVQSDGELATIIAHEIGHVLAGHTEPNPADEVSQIISGVASRVASDILQSQGGYYGLAAGLAEVLIGTTVDAVLINPGSRSDELEADYIGLFLMADAGYDPHEAISFWERARFDPELSGATLQFLSSHPGSEERLKELEKYLDEAAERYASSAPQAGTKADTVKGPPRRSSGERWRVSSEWATIYAAPDSKSKVVIDLPHNTDISVHTTKSKKWLKVTAPVEGYVAKEALSKISDV